MTLGAKMTGLFPLQQSIYSRLSTDIDLMAKITGVFDDVPDGQVFPYVTLGEDTVTDWSTKTNYGEELTHTLHVWSRYKGKKEVKEIMSLILQSITSEPLALAGGFFVNMAQVEFMEVFTDPDGITKHGVMRFRFNITQQ